MSFIEFMLTNPLALIFVAMAYSNVVCGIRQDATHAMPAFFGAFVGGILMHYVLGFNWTW
jgi:hypothetical protein